MQFNWLIYFLLLAILVLYYGDDVRTIGVFSFSFLDGHMKAQPVKKAKETKGNCDETSTFIVHNRTMKHHKKAQSEPSKNNPDIKKTSKGFMATQQLLRGEKEREREREREREHCFQITDS